MTTISLWQAVLSREYRISGGLMAKDHKPMTQGWQFWVDRGGTFTDVIGLSPSHQLHSHKLLSENSEQYKDAASAGIQAILTQQYSGSNSSLKDMPISEVRMGTTVATNALLERKGETTLLIVTRGFKDVLRIGYQTRPELFSLHIKKPEQLYSAVVEVSERLDAEGRVLQALNLDEVREPLTQYFNQGFKSVAIVLMHSYQNNEHELKLAEVAKDIGFTQISLSSQVSPTLKIVGRGDTTVVDAYLNPILRQHVEEVVQNVGHVPLTFMQSNGGMAHSERFQGKDAILSGPAGGVVGMVKTARSEGFQRLIGFDMGGTSTDVSHYDHDDKGGGSGLQASEQKATAIDIEEFERCFETEVAGVRVRTPMMQIHTVAAGGGSKVFFEQGRYRVGPESAGASPGPACYGKQGPLTVTDCQLILGRIQPSYFPKVFGLSSNEPINSNVAEAEFIPLQETIFQQTGLKPCLGEIAASFITVAVDNMATAIKKISVQRGYDLNDYTLCAFGGAGGQHACLVANALEIDTIFLHKQASLLSAFGIGLADKRYVAERSLDYELSKVSHSHVEQSLLELSQEHHPGKQSREELSDSQRVLFQRAHIKYAGSDTTLLIEWSDIEKIKQAFSKKHQQEFGFFHPDQQLWVESIQIEWVVRREVLAEPNEDGASSRWQWCDISDSEKHRLTPVETWVATFDLFEWQHAQKTHQLKTPVYLFNQLNEAHRILGPALIIDKNTTVVVDKGWAAKISHLGNLVLTTRGVNLSASMETFTQNASTQNPSTQNPSMQKSSTLTSLPSHEETQESDQLDNVVSPMRLEIYNNFFRSVAEQMGTVLEKTAVSVNIKERLDFSCAVFNSVGELIANAPHIPVHLGSMSDSVKAVISSWNEDQIRSGDAFVLNSPYQGGTHLPDITVVKPVFDESKSPTVLFWVAARGHHGDVGGITPGSMPPYSQHIDEEGVHIHPLRCMRAGKLLMDDLTQCFTQSKYPVRNLEQNLADLSAQLASCQKGEHALQRVMLQHGAEEVVRYSNYVMDNAEQSVRRLIATHIKPGFFAYPMDDGSRIAVNIKLEGETLKHSKVIIDFEGSSGPHKGNFNAPQSVVRAVVLYAFRCLIEDDIPLNDGIFRALELRIPDSSLLNPKYPSAVVAGNVETAQQLADILFAALGASAAAQGTNNNLTFGNDAYQYYETLCGGTGAGPNFDGASGVHAHMTNSRLTDPEVFEKRYPVLLEAFGIRKGSGGKGSYNGGEGIVRRIRFLEAMTVAIISGRRLVPPFGLKGGLPGLQGKNLWLKANGDRQPLAGCEQVLVSENDAIEIQTPGGGGYDSL